MDRVLWVIVGFVMAAVVLLALSSLMDAQFGEFGNMLTGMIPLNMLGG